jgi:predicted CopG family antitoxin
MATKNISIMDDVYDLLKSMKRSEESFSEEIRRLIKPKGSILDLAGSWSDMSDEEADKIKENVENLRKSTRLAEIHEMMK